MRWSSGSVPIDGRAVKSCGANCSCTASAAYTKVQQQLLVFPEAAVAIQAQLPSANVCSMCFCNGLALKGRGLL